MNEEVYQLGPQLTKFQVTISFEMDDAFMSLVPPHRTYINYLINKGIIDHYTVSLESLRSWIVMNAENKKQVEDYLKKSPLHKYWTYEIDELYIYDGQGYRMPAVQLN
ncbi:MAG: hypothetical protein ABIX01_17770 [Chitinophagaceae bacterium]